MTRSPDRTFQAAARDALLMRIHQQQTDARAPHRTRISPSLRDAVRVSNAVLIAGATIATAWLGVTALQQHPPTTPPAAHTAQPSSRPSASPSPTRRPDPVRAAFADIVGAGTLSGPITGTFTITQEYGYPVLHLENLDLGTSTARRILTTVDLDSATCRADRVGTIAGSITTGSNQDVPLQNPVPFDLGDISYFHALAIWPADGCVADQVSAGTIDWTIPAAIRRLADTDHGARSGATGTTELRDDRPIRYTVAGDDQIDAVASRFGLTETYLLYLNPLRRRGDRTDLQAGERLNLDPLGRDWFWV